MEENKNVTMGPPNGGTNQSQNGNEGASGCFFMLNVFLIFVLLIIGIMKGCDRNFKDIYEDDKPLHDRTLVDKDAKQEKAKQTKDQPARQKAEPAKQVAPKAEPVETSGTVESSKLGAQPKKQKPVEQEPEPEPTSGGGWHIEF